MWSGEFLQWTRRIRIARCRKAARTTVPYRYVRPYTTCFVGMTYALTRRVKLRLHRIEKIRRSKMLVISALDTPHFQRIGHWHMASCYFWHTKVRHPSIVTWQHHETEEDRDAQDRAGRPSAVAARRPAQTTRRPERPEDRAARWNELRRVDRVSPEAPEHALQRKAPQRRCVRPRERQRQRCGRPIGLARRAHRPAR